MLPPSLSRLLVHCLLLTDLVLGQISEWTTPPQISCPEGSKAYGSHCYGVFQKPRTWNSAELNCQGLTSGHLLSLMDESEAAFVAALATQSLGDSRSHLWIGLHDPFQNRRWHWSNNAMLTLDSWAKGAPAKTTLKFCVTLSPRSGFLQWKDQHCNEELPFICKFSA
ncbi:lithostathine-1-beta-like isoform X2 [Dromiciops gliroides]|uniref:lithostathine-1-beta-like isoform X2 n=1 Tax=Dromiciops gliroides TaxID=33562 RepID=UPI001CC69122|nr:lithostathine-1-beta-like isoform X2 [Dromiciops gliroides]